MTTTFDLKGSVFTLTVLKLKSADLDTLQQELQNKIAEAPNFFANAPIVIDLQALAFINPVIDFTRLAALLRSFHLIPIGVRNGSADHHRDAIQAGLACLPNLKIQEVSEDKPKEPSSLEITTQKTTTENTEEENSHPLSLPSTYTRIVVEPVRSGKQLYVRGGDLLVLGSVSHGAEVLADGNIHVYGPLRGRALAGVRGDTKARIFCRQLDAELISIAGHYKISEEIAGNRTDNNDLKHIYLEEDEIKIAAL